MTAPNLRLLLAEDNPDDAELQLREIRRAGLRVTHKLVDSADAFTSALRSFAPDIILSDFSMPNFDGMDALRLAREMAPDTPFLFVSATLGEEYAIRALKNGATDYVIKTNIARLPAAVERAIAEAEVLRERRRAGTELEIARERLLEREAGLRRAQAMAKLAHVITGEAGGFESWSENLPELIGVQPHGMPANTREWLDLLDPDDRERFRATSIEAGRTGRRSELEYRLRRNDRQWIDVRQVMELLGGQGKRWFNTLLDITEEKLAQAELRASEALKGAILESSLDGLVTIDAEGRIVEFNPAAEKIFGIARTQALGTRFAGYLAGGEAPHVGKHVELEALRADGSAFPIELAVVPITSGGAPLFTGFIRDITTRRNAAARISRLNRVYAVLSGITGLIVRVRDRDELFREACRIAVEAGGFKLAWIGVVDRRAMRVAPVASAGAAQGYVELMPLDLQAEVHRGLAAQAIMQKQAMIANDIASDVRIKLREQALQRGFRSLVILPLALGDEVAAVLALYAEAPGFFDQQEMRLLAELGGDISFCLNHLRNAEKLDYLAYYDDLTGLANRKLLRERLTQYLHAAAEGGCKLALMIVDLERFRAVNDSLGRQAGDILLAEASRRLKENVGDATQLARLGADQFAVVFPAVKSELDAGRLLLSLSRTCLKAPFQIAGTELMMSSRAGMALYPDHGSDADAILGNAEAALQKAKRAGEPYLFFEQTMTERLADNLNLESALRRALEREEFVLHYQPRVDLSSRAVRGVEALMRWQRPDGLVPPAKFIPLLEETGLIIEVGAWALQQAAVQHRKWLEAGGPTARIAVNVSAKQLRQKEFVSIIQGALEQGAAQPGIDLELTESMLMEDVSTSIDKLRAVRDLGVGVAIDDFGTGYSSLGYLAKLPVSSLKIDRSFVITMLSDSSVMTLVTTMISLAHSLRLKIVAEGVETEEQAEALRAAGCDEMQGYLFSKPLPADAVFKLIREEPARARSKR